MAALMIGLCLVATAMVTVICVVRWWRNPEHLRWLRIEQRARTRAAAQRAAEKYAFLPSVTVVPFTPALEARFRVAADEAPAGSTDGPGRPRPTAA